MSILRSVRVACNIMPDCEDFDVQLVPHINTTFLSTRLLGLGPPSGASVTSDLDTWDSIFGEELKSRDLDAVKTYIGLKVRMLFDPPTSQSHISALQSEIDRLEWLLNVQVETPVIEKEE